MLYMQGRIQDFKLGGTHLKKITPSGGRRENCWGISCVKFYAKFFFPILGGARAGCAHPTGPAPDMDGAHENESHKLCVSSVRRSYKK